MNLSHGKLIENSLRKWKNKCRTPPDEKNITTTPFDP